MTDGLALVRLVQSHVLSYLEKSKANVQEMERCPQTRHLSEMKKHCWDRGRGRYMKACLWLRRAQLGPISCV